MKSIHWLMRKRTPFCTALFATVLFASFPATAAAQEITVQLMNGNNRRTLGGYRVYIVLGDPHTQHILDLKTDREGKVRFDTQGVTTFQVRPVGTVPCSDPAKGASSPDPDVAGVLKHGFVTRNDCGKFNPEPQRGQVTYLARNASGWQLFRN